MKRRIRILRRLAFALLAYFLPILLRVDARAEAGGILAREALFLHLMFYNDCLLFNNFSSEKLADIPKHITLLSGGIG